MDFEISDDGTLIRYSGAGGDVVIPEGRNGAICGVSA